MRIIELRAENFKRLSAVTITPKGDIVTIAGKNEQGKSSVLDSIWAALGGVANLPPEPIRTGQDKATVRLDLGEYIVTRTIRRGKEEGDDYTTTLLVENADGVRPKSPQTLLDDLMGHFTMDPLEFQRMTPKRQFDALKVFVPGLDLDEMKALDDADYEKRTATNRRVSEAEAAAAAVGAKEGKAERVPTDDIQAQLAGASDKNREIEARRKRREEAERKAAGLEDKVKLTLLKVAKTKENIAALVKEAADLEAQADNDAKQALELREKLAGAEKLPELVNTAELAKALSDANMANAEADKQDRRDEHLAKGKEAKKLSDALTAAMDARAEQVKAAIKAAKFPVEGLSLGKEEVLVDGLPFANAATSKKIRTSLALAMMGNPKIRIVRIMEGSLLDSDAMKVVADMAKDNDFQVWLEVVNDGDAKTGVLIEDGHVASA